MVHNGIEYGMMQAYAEGFEIMKASEFGSTCARSPRSGSTAASCARGCSSCSHERSSRIANLDGIRGYVDDSGEGRWTVNEAIDEAVPAPAITMALFARFASRQDESFAAKVIAALRNEFGGHAVKRDESSEGRACTSDPMRGVWPDPAGEIRFAKGCASRASPSRARSSSSVPPAT